MIDLILGMSIMLNIMLLLLLLAYSDKEKKEENPYKGLEDMLRDDSWGRIDNIDPPQEDSPKHTLVASVGKRTGMKQR